jgi:hypothetical protein
MFAITIGKPFSTHDVNDDYEWHDFNKHGKTSTSDNTVDGNVKRGTRHAVLTGVRVALASAAAPAAEEDDDDEEKQNNCDDDENPPQVGKRSSGYTLFSWKREQSMTRMYGDDSIEILFDSRLVFTKS